ncbi:MAG: CCA tRNA nucleotidyltransferase, partial [Bartonella sp.]|nr:CCA tRNA nucleotidyltransferase [Bartonella sp.]
DMKLKKFIYYHGRQAVLDQLSLELSSARSHAISKDSALVEAGHFARLREFATTYQIPVLPVSGKDLLALGFEAGPNVGRQLKTLEKLWVDSGFRLDREALLATVKQ